MSAGTILEPEVASGEAASQDSDELVVFRKQDAIAARLRKDYMGLTVAGVNDAAGAKVVHDARIIVRDARIAIEDTRVQMKAGILDRGRKIDAEAKRVTALITPIERHLQEQEDIVLNEQKRLRQAEEDARRAALQKRLEALVAFGVVGSPAIIEAMNDERFGYELTKAREAYDARQLAEAEAAEKRRQEEAALAAERERQEKVRKQQEAEAGRLRADRERLESEKRTAELAKAKAEAAEKARVEADQRHAREQASAKAEREAEEQARRKAEAERPQREKLLAVAEAIQLIQVPDGAGSSAVRGALLECYATVRRIANGPL